jgi:hypothetical protein
MIRQVDMKILVNVSLLVFSLFVFSPQALASSIKGTIKLGSSKKNGVLFIYARRFGQRRGPPIAVKRVNAPRFPYQFELSQSNVMLQGTPFQGPMRIEAKLSPSGNAMDRSGPKGSTVSGKRIFPGNSNIEITLK